MAGPGDEKSMGGMIASISSAQTVTIGVAGCAVQCRET